VDGPLLIGGDFNATIYHQQFRNVLGDTLVDATSSAAGTWPASSPPLIAAPIDHILLSAPFERVASGTWDIPDTDHRAVWIDITAPIRSD
jgi:endonuclease/exonuclease/phosphatase family metal-dependent hydrolase